MRRLQRLFSLGKGYIARHGVLGTLRFAFRLVRHHGIGGARAALRLRLAGPAVVSRFRRERARNPYVVPHSVSVDIIVCVHNAREDVQRCLDALLLHTLPPYRIILVDDGSDADTQTYLATFAAEQGAVLIRNDSARGYTLAANQGLRASQAELKLLLNSDTIVSPCWLDRMIACLISDKRIGMVGPVSNAASWQSIPQTREGEDWAENPLPESFSIAYWAESLAAISAQHYPRVGFLNGFCLLLRAAMLKKIGLFDEETFGAGYGEENDLALRAQSAGWELAVADDAYVYHAQSKSYSHERRRTLAARADAALHAKHGSERIGRALALTVESPALAGLRARAAHMAARQALIDDTRARYEGKRIFFVLPVRHAGGGGHVVLTEAEALMRMGVNVTVVNFAAHRAFFEDQHPGLKVPVHYIDGPEGLGPLARRADAMVATLFLSVQWLKDYAAACPALAYYIQDYEPWFFPESDPMHAVARASYTAIPGMRLMTKSQWNAQIVKTQTGCGVTLLGPSYDWLNFHPSQSKPGDGGPIRITAMIRPATPRRAPERTVRVLSGLHREFGSGIEIVLFGAGAAECKALGIDFPHIHAGEIPAREVAGLLDRSDIFLDLSDYQAMGLTALEALASGVAVVAPLQGGTREFMTDEGNGLLVDTGDEAACLQAARRLIAEHDLRRRLRTAGPPSVACFYPEAAARRLLDALFGS